MAQQPQKRSQGRTGQQGSPSGTREKILRIGVILGGKIVEERLIRVRETVTIGQSAKNTFSIPAPELPRTWPLFKLVGHQYQLNVNDSMDGRLSDGGNVLALAQLKASGSAQKQAQGYAINLSDNARGKIILGDLTLLFQFVVAPPLQPRPQLPHSVKGRLADRIDPYLAIILVLSFILHGGVTLYVYRMDVPRKPEPDEIPDKYPKAWLQAPPAPPKEETKGKGEEPKPDETKDEKVEDKKGDDKPKKDNKPAKDPAPDDSGDTQAKAQERAEKRGAIAVVGVANPSGGPGKFANVNKDGYGGGDLQKGIDKARQEGVELATNGDGGKGTKGGQGNIGPGEGKGPAGPKGTDTGKDKVTEEKVPTGVTKIEKTDEIENEGLDADGVLRKIRGNYFKQIEKCYNDSLKANTGLKGRVEITISIAPTGRVSNAEVEGFDGAMDSCIKSRAKTWVFENPEKKKASFLFAFSFKPKG